MCLTLHAADWKEERKFSPGFQSFTKWNQCFVKSGGELLSANTALKNFSLYVTANRRNRNAANREPIIFGTKIGLSLRKF